MNNFEESNALSETSNLLEQSMKDLLEKILSYMEKFIKTKDDLSVIESKLNDYDNLLALMDIIKNIFTHLTEKIDVQLQKSIQMSGIYNNDEYDQLEKIVQKHEAEIRTHISLEQQLKLYSESIQQKLDDSEKARSELLDSTKQLINGVKRDNQKLSESVKILKEENQKLSMKLMDYENKDKQLEQQYNVLLQDKNQSLENQLKVSKQKQNSNSMHILQKENSFRRNQQDKDDSKNNKNTTETPPNNKSPAKENQRAFTPVQTVLSASKNSVNKSQNSKDMKHSYQRFYNQVKQARDESIKTASKDMKTIYSNSKLSYKQNHKERAISQNMSHPGSSNQHKRSKSQQTKNNNSKSQTKNTDMTRLSNQDFKDMNQNLVSYLQKNNQK